MDSILASWFWTMHAVMGTKLRFPDNREVDAVIARRESSSFQIGTQYAVDVVLQCFLVLRSDVDLSALRVGDLLVDVIRNKKYVVTKAPASNHVWTSSDPYDTVVRIWTKLVP